MWNGPPLSSDHFVRNASSAELSSCIRHNIFPIWFCHRLSVRAYQICTSYSCRWVQQTVRSELFDLSVRLKMKWKKKNNSEPKTTCLDVEAYLLLLTASPIDWTTIWFAIINWNASGHQTVCIMNFDVTFNLLTVWIVNNTWVVKVFITNACIATDAVGKHFLTFDIFLVLQIAACTWQLFDFISIWKITMIPYENGFVLHTERSPHNTLTAFIFAAASVKLTLIDAFRFRSIEHLWTFDAWTSKLHAAEMLILLHKKMHSIQSIERLLGKSFTHSIVLAQ